MGVGIKPGIGLPWRDGPQRATGAVWVTATRFTFTTTPAALAAGPHALRFWRRWAAVPGAIGLSVSYQPIGRVAWTLSVWTDASDLDAFLLSPPHRAVVRAFSHRLAGTSTGWETTDFDLRRDWSRAVDVLVPASTHPLTP
jgi:hypothetical protein